MQKVLIISGRLVGPTHVELNEPVGDVTTDVQVLVSPIDTAADREAWSFAEFIRHLPEGTRSKEDIDEQVGSERDAWGAR